MEKGVLESLEGGRWRLTIEHDDGTPPDVLEGSLRLVLDVIDDLAIDVREIKRPEARP